MRGTKSKRIRRLVYGDYSSHPEARKYHIDGRTGMLHADKRRKLYQGLKRRV